MSKLTKKSEEEMEGEIGNPAAENTLLKAEVKGYGNLAAENARLKAEVDKLNLDKKSLQEGEAKEKMRVTILESEKRDLLAEISHMKGQVEFKDASELEGKKDDRDKTPVFHFANPTALSASSDAR